MIAAEATGRRPIRVLYCIDYIGLGGTEKQLMSLITSLDRTRVLPCLCTLRPSHVDLGALGCSLLTLDAPASRSAEIARTALRLRRYLRSESIDVVHAFFQDPPTLAVLATRMMRRRPRLVASFRDLGFWHTPFKLRQMRWVYRHCDGFLANSKAVADKAASSYAIPRERISVVYNGIDPGPPPPEAAGRPPIVVVVANLNRAVKRVDLFLDAAKLIRERQPAARFLILGDGPLRPALEAQAARLGLTGAVSFEGRVANVSERLREAAVGVIPSDSEGFSNAALEYMGAGIPTVARAVGGNTELVKDGLTGTLVTDDSPCRMADAILGYLNDEERRQRAGRAAREAAIREHPLEGCARDHESYYLGLFRAPGDESVGGRG